MKELHGTTVIAVRRGPRVAIAADGQVTLGNTVIKHGAKKTRRLHDGSIVAGFAGGTADAFALFEHFEAKLKDHSGNLTRAAVELAKDWRTDRILRRLEAMLVVADSSKTLLLTGAGDVVEPDGGAVGIGSGGSFAQSAASALLTHTALDPAQIAREALRIASEICIYTNQHVSLEELGAPA